MEDFIKLKTLWGVRLEEWLKSMPSNQASAGPSSTCRKYLTGDNLIPSEKTMGNHPCEN